ncbi:molybdenum cofactor guanylyltransferase [Halorientalis salina]|uniref:molybdenum cofactor guanylyltransferase n=1 Tax=Halorientalis salina TaxID=2932266 RepID=UPI0010ABBC23|nr:molybdenum cofactor guanylyltransferase [Halorientalis salina]
MGSKQRVGVVLAGGYSTRFGEQEKALADLNGRALLAHVVTGVAPAVDRVLVNCRRDQLEDFQRALASTATDVEFVCDPEPDKGPAAGLRTALDAVSEPMVAVVACDMPFVDAAFLDWLFEEVNGADGAVPYVDGAPQPTHSVFATEPTRRAANDAVRNASGSLRDVLDRLDLVEIPEYRVVGKAAKTAFTDVNTPEELPALMADDGAESNSVN